MNNFLGSAGSALVLWRLPTAWRSVTGLRVCAAIMLDVHVLVLHDARERCVIKHFVTYRWTLEVISHVAGATAAKAFYCVAFASPAAKDRTGSGGNAGWQADET